MLSPVWTPIPPGISRLESMEFSDLYNYYLGRVPGVDRWHETRQDSVWHAEGSVYNHVSMVVEKLHSQDLTGVSHREFEMLTHATFLHDCGKPFVSFEEEKNGRVRIVSPGHAEYGRSMLASYLPSLYHDDAFVAQVLALVGYHHHPKTIAAHPNRKKLLQIARCVRTDLLYRLEMADIRGRICPDADVQIAILNTFRDLLEKEGLYGVQRNTPSCEGEACDIWLEETGRHTSVGRYLTILVNDGGEDVFDAQAMVDSLKRGYPIVYRSAESSFRKHRKIVLAAANSVNAYVKIVAKYPIFPTKMDWPTLTECQEVKYVRQ